MPFQKVAVFLLDEDGIKLNMVKSAGLSDSYIEWSQGIDAKSSVRTSVLQTGEPLAISDIADVPRFRDFVDLAHEEGYSAFLDLPLYSGTQIIGSMTAYYDKPHRFDPSEIELMQTLGGQIVIAVENARLFDEMQARTAELAMLYDASTVINASLSLKNVLRAVAISMIQALQTKSCLALVAMEDRQELRAELLMLSGAEGILDDNLAEFSVMIDALPKVQAALRRQQPMVLYASSEDLSPTERSLLMHTAAQSAVVVPLVARNEPVGLIISGTPDGQHTYLMEQLRLAEALANQAAVAIENAVLFERTDIALSRRLDEITSLELISQRMTRRLDLQTVIEHVMHAAKAATSAEFGEVALYDENTHYLNVAVQRNEVDDSSVEMGWAATVGISARAIRSGQPVLVDDVASDPDYHPARRAIRSELVVPIILEGRRLGLINLESTRLAAFNLDHLRFVTNLAEHAAIAIQNARLFETVQHRAEEFNTLRSIAVDLLSSSDVKQALQVIARGAMDRTRANSVHIYLYNQRDDALTFGASLWSSGEQDLELTPPRPNGLTMSVARSGERIVIANTRQHPMFTAEATQTAGWSGVSVEALGSIIGVPLKRGNDVIGVFNIAFEESATISEDVLRFLDFLAAQASVAVANAGLQEETRTNRDLLQAILDSSHDGIVMVDNQQRLVMANSRAEYLLNTHLQDCLGRPVTTILRQLIRASGTRDAFTDRQAHDMARRLKENPNQITRRRYVFPQPHYQAIEESSLPVMDDNNALLGRVFILRDITQEVELENFRQEMSHMLVHDLRSPLGGVITGVHTALDEIEVGQESGAGPDLPMVQTMLGVALSSGQALLRLVESILDIHKLETGEMPLHLETTTLSRLAERAQITLENTARSGAITVELDAPADLPGIRIDGEKIERVMVNLLDNALRYTPQGGNVWMSIECSEGSQTFTVRDNGDGVPQELWSRIFDRFVQADTTRRKRGSKGSGLGLTFCKLAVEAHGGHIWVDRAPEGGAAFHFMLPMADS